MGENDQYTSGKQQCNSPTHTTGYLGELQQALPYGLARGAPIDASAQMSVGGTSDPYAPYRDAERVLSNARVNAQMRVAHEDMRCIREYALDLAVKTILATILHYPPQDRTRDDRIIECAKRYERYLTGDEE